jgi:RNA polymerase sigma factor (sigma-70 family)
VTVTASDVLIELVQNAAEGDREAQQSLIEKYWPVIRHAVRARKSRLGPRLGAREETEDLEQSAAMRVLGDLAQHRWQGRSSFAAWIKRLSELEVVDAFRHHVAQKRDVGMEAPLDPEAPRMTSRSPESRFDDDVRFDRLLAEVEQLKSEYAAALLMHHLGFSHAEIGETLGCTPEAARKLVTRARLRLLERVGDVGS